MTGIKNMLTMMLNGCDAISEEETRRFQIRESWKRTAGSETENKET